MKTTVKWLMQTLEQNNIIDLDLTDSDKYYTIIEQAKEMEKQQVIDFAFYFRHEEVTKEEIEQYYKEQF